VRITHDFSARGFDAYWTCEEAILSLIVLEAGRAPWRIWSRRPVLEPSSRHSGTRDTSSPPATFF